jgi:hypothetical protein
VAVSSEGLRSTLGSSADSSCLLGLNRCYKDVLVAKEDTCESQ